MTHCHVLQSGARGKSRCWAVSSSTVSMFDTCTNISTNVLQQKTSPALTVSPLSLSARYTRYPEHSQHFRLCAIYAAPNKGDPWQHWPPRVPAVNRTFCSQQSLLGSHRRNHTKLRLHSSPPFTHTSLARQAHNGTTMTDDQHKCCGMVNLPACGADS